MFTKFASFEVSQTLEVKGAAEQQRTASLDKLADYHDYRTEDGYLYARITAISSRVNKNNDGWPSVELAGGQDTFDKYANVIEGIQGEPGHGFTVEASSDAEVGFSTFVGKPIFIDHNNSDTKRARGVIVDSKLHVQDHHQAALDSYYSSDDVDEEHLPPTKVELLLEIDAKSFPKLARAIVEGSKDPDKGIDGFSMGCDVAESRCSHCGNKASSPREYCSHIKMKGAEQKITSGKHQGKSRKSYENCYGIKFFEISAVFDPADETALLKELVNENPSHEAAVTSVPCPQCGAPAQFSTEARTGTCPNGHSFQNPAAGRFQQQAPAQVVPQHAYAAVGDMVGLPCAQCHGAGVNGYSPCEACGGTGKTGEVQHGPTTPGNDGAFMLSPDQQPGYGEPQDLGVGDPIHQGPEVHVPAETPGAIMAPNFTLSPQAPLLQRVREHIHKPFQGSYLQARTAAKQSDFGRDQHTKGENPLPQFMHPSAPADVDTLRKEKICPVCGEQMEGEKCATCGHLEAPDGFNNPDLQQAQQNGLGAPDQPGVNPGEAPNSAQPGLLDGAPAPGAAGAVSYLQSRKKGNPTEVTGAATVTAGKIKTVERPIKPGQTPATDEPNEAVVNDQIEPVTSTYRTAMDLIRAAKSNQGTQNMSDKNKTAADAPSGVGAQKRVDAEGVGGVEDASNAGASKPDATTSPTGKGGVHQDSNAEASKPDSTESLPTAGADSDDSGFNKDKTTDDSGPTKTWDNSNEPGSAVTDKAFPVEAAKTGVKPQGGADVQPQRREQLETVNEVKPIPGTQQWTGTGGNGVTKQQDPVTKKVDPNIEQRSSSFAHVVAAMKLADAEVELGLLDKDHKYDRVAELEALTPEELAAEERVISRVRTAGLTKTTTRREAATREGEVGGRLPSFQKKAGELEPKVAQEVNDTLADASLFLR